MARYVLDTNNKWLLAFSDRTIKIMSPDMEVNCHNPPSTQEQWKEVARVGSNNLCNHRELHVWGVVFSGQKLEDLSVDIINEQVLVNRDGYMCMYFNVGAPNMYLNHAGHTSLMRRHNDLFNWAKYGVNVPVPLETMWDRFQLGTGKMMVNIRTAREMLLQLPHRMAEKDKEIERLKRELEQEKKRNEEEQRKKDEMIKKLKMELEKRNVELQEAENGHDEEDAKLIADLKAKLAADAQELKRLRQELAARDRRIQSLRAALQAFL
ncbi:hypothetical protein LINGRAHAP2_LOCUS28070 [Linum grandiflorum]